MKNIGTVGIIVDSSTGISEKEANKRGWGFLPLLLTINGKDYKDGVDITEKEYYKNLKITDEMKTGTTSPLIVEETLKEASAKFDHVIVHVISQGLSSQYQHVSIAAKEFDNVHVINTTSVASLIVTECEAIERDTKTMETIEEVMDAANARSKEAFGIVMPLTMDWLKKGGRVSGATAALGNLLNIIPVIGFNPKGKGKLEKVDKGRVFNKTIVKMATKHLFVDKGEEWNYHVHSAYHPDIDMFIEKLKKATGVTEFIEGPVPPVIANHVGPGTICILRSKK